MGPHNATMNSTADQLDEQLEQATMALAREGYSPGHHIAAIRIDDQSDRGARKPTRAVVLCNRTVTMAVMLVPSHWQDPTECGQRLVVPPDPDGWAVMDFLIASGVDDIQFQSV